MRTDSWVRILWFTAIGPCAVGCLPAADFPGDPDMGAAVAAPGPMTGAGPSLDEASILALVANGSYHYSPQLAPVNHGGAYPSAIAMSTDINVWVTAADFNSYAKIAPDKSGSGASVPPGAMIVREVLDAQGAVAKLTLMVKGPAGYNPDAGDFWFGMTQPDGTPVVDNGSPQLGKLTQCFGCHQTRASDGYLFGVPQAYRGGGGGGGGMPDGGVVIGGGEPADGGSNGH